MPKLSALSVVLALIGCTPQAGKDPSRNNADVVRTVEGLGDFTFDGEDMWDGVVEIDGAPVEVTLHVFGSDFKTISDYAKRVIVGKSLPDHAMQEEIRSGIKSLSWKFKEYKFDAALLDAQQFRITRMLFGRDIDSPKLEHSVTLRYPDDGNHWLLSYYDEHSGSLNWIPKD